MTTLTSKLEEITKRLRQLTVWRPNELDPFVELDRWRADCFSIIEQIYTRKKQHIEQLTDKHEREYMRQLTRQRTLLNHIRKRIVPQKDSNTLPAIQNESSILNDLQAIENNINTKLGRAEIHVAVGPLNLEDSVTISLKTYLSVTPSVCVKEVMLRNDPQKPTPRSAGQVAQAYDSWLQAKRQIQADIIRAASISAQQREQDMEQRRMDRAAKSKKSFDEWLDWKNAERAAAAATAAVAAAKIITSSTFTDDARPATTGT